MERAMLKKIAGYILRKELSTYKKIIEQKEVANSHFHSKYLDLQEAHSELHVDHGKLLQNYMGLCDKLLSIEREYQKFQEMTEDSIGVRPISELVKLRILNVNPVDEDIKFAVATKGTAISSIHPGMKEAEALALPEDTIRLAINKEISNVQFINPDMQDAFRNRHKEASIIAKEVTGQFLRSLDNEVYTGVMKQLGFR